MPTLVERARSVISAEDDNFFVDDTILDYINKSQEKVASYLIRLETNMRNRTLRALDGLRKTQTITIGSGDLALENDNYVGSLAFPADLKQRKYLEYNGQTPLRELDPSNLALLQWSNLRPTELESYYVIINDGSKKFKIYLFENIVGNDVKIHYIKEPSEVTIATETLQEIPFQLENAVVYGAAVMMLGQESVKDPESNIQAIQSIYKEELENNIF